MPTPVPAARQCLSPAAVTALDAAAASARRRAHAQTTSLHLISSLLTPPSPPLLRDALARARSAAYSPRVQLKALDLCFAVSLDRLPSVSASSSSSADEPPVSNSLMAAIKRSQANQRRNPDTFHFYHQAATAQTPAAVKVELSQLILAILDDPVVSRVFGEAGFRCGDIKLAILRPAPPMPLLSRGLPTRSRPPPLFLCSFAAADDADVPSPAGNLAGAGEENCRRIAEILSRGRNPMLVGVGAASAADDFAAASPYRIIHVEPNSIDKSDLGVAAAMASATSGLIISIGDLKQLVSDEAEVQVQERGRRVVAEVTRVVETHSKVGRVWVMGWSATYETYLAFLSKFPLVDKDWDLQLLPITAVHAAAATAPPATTLASFSKPARLMESFVPFGGFLCDNYETNSPTANSCPQALFCQQCNDNYEQEAATIIRASGITAEDHHQGGVPSLLQNGSMVGPNNGFDTVKVVGRQEEALKAICESIVHCRSTESRRGPNRKDIWLCFHGSDSIAKKRVAVALAELMYGSKENLIYLDLNLQYWVDSNFRGKTGTDCIVEQLSKKRRSILFLDNIDRADCLVQDSLSDAIETGRFQDMRRKAVDINDSIVVLSRSMMQGRNNGVDESLSFSEEKILTARGHQLKILVEPGRSITSGSSSGKLVVSPRHFLTKIQASLYFGSISKRKLSISDDQENQQESPISSNRLYRTSSVPFDLNLPVDEDEPHDADDDSSSHENSYGNKEKSIDTLFHLVDESVNFKPFDFDKLADDMLQEFSSILGKNLGPECRLDIDVGAMEQILAAIWKSEDKSAVQTWLEQVFAKSLDELKLKCKHGSL
ncbi:hypothetical protein E2562_030138 [Oryza meyeriana var. granulata]|uniref:Clp R domain-containing protein n=1 Tax=Oryza meyeriana var. granulata TaxID=110450 RepID=A0A6G1BPG6_9ORYZ|nr:hypothetical protein E2562_030138 [Oryza meyeriana var. granulata]